MRVGGCQAVAVVGFGGHGLEAGLTMDAKSDRLGCITWCLESAGRNKMRNYINNSLIVRVGGC